METSLLLPDPTEPTAAGFWEGTAAGELRVQACADCGAWAHPPRPMCPACRSVRRTWVVTSGRGRIWSFVVAHPPLLPAYSLLAPYNVVIVELEEDPLIRFVGNLVAGADGPINEIDPATIVIGQPVLVVFQAVDDVVLPRWIQAPPPPTKGAS
jgi:uncharacterized OB-fold protein